MDKTTFTNKKVLWNKLQCGMYADMDSCKHIPAGSYNKETAEIGTGILQIFSISLFEKVPLNQLFTDNDYRNMDSDNYNQLKLFDL